jgi:hypothetical protein
MSEDIVRYDAKPGDDIYSTVGHMLSMARFTGCRVIAQFNQHVLMADPSHTAKDVLAEWDASQRRSYFGGDR